MRRLPSRRSITVGIHLLLAASLAALVFGPAPLSEPGSIAYTYTAADRATGLDTVPNDGDGILWFNASGTAVTGETGQHLITVNNTLSSTQNVTVELSQDIANWHLTASGDKSRTVQLGSGVTEGFYVDIGSDAATGEARYYVRSNDSTFWFSQTRTINVTSGGNTSGNSTGTTIPYTYVVENDTLHKLYATNKTRVWTYSNQSLANLTTVTTGPDGDVYIGTASERVQRLAPNGSLVWAVNTSKDSTLNQVDDMTVSSSGDAYVASNTLTKLSATGSVLWDKSIGYEPTGVALGPDGTVYMSSKQSGGFTASNVSFRLRPNGSTIWAGGYGNATKYDITVDREGAAYAVENADMTKFAKNGTWMWNRHMRNTTSIGHAVAWSPNGYLYIGWGSGEIRKYQMDASQIWNFTNATDTYALDVAPDGHVYAAHRDDTAAQNVSSAGQQQWNFTLPSTRVTGVAVYPDAGFTQPIAEYTYSPTSPDPGDTVTFNASGSVDSDGNITKYEWDFDGDGTVDATGVTVTHTYSTEGTYSATLTVTDNDGNTDTAGNEVRVSDGVSYVYTATYGTGTVHKLYAGNKSFVWNYSITKSGDNISSIKVGPNGYVYVGGNETLQKLAPNGSLVWNYTNITNNEDVHDIHVTPNGSVYFAAAEVEKVSADGSFVWDDANMYGPRALDVGPRGYVYAGGVYSATYLQPTVAKFYPNNGSIVWSDVLLTSTWSVEVDSERNLYTGQETGSIQKWTPAGNSIWTKDPLPNVSTSAEKLDMGPNQTLYAAWQNGIVTRQRTNGSRIANITLPGTGSTWGISTAPSGMVYAPRGSNVTKLNASGATQWQYTNHSTTVEGVAASPRVNYTFPDAAFTHSPSTPSPGAQVSFNASRSADWNGDITSYKWDFDGNGTVDATGKTATHTFPVTGNFSVTLTVEDTDGNTATEVRNVTVEVETGYVYIGRETDNLVKARVTDGSNVWSVNSAYDYSSDSIAVGPNFVFVVSNESLTKRTLSGKRLWTSGSGLNKDISIDPENASVYASHLGSGKFQKYSYNGTLVWNESVTDIFAHHVSRSGDAYVASFSGTGYLLKYAPDGTLLWNISANVTKNSEELVTDSEGNVYVSNEAVLSKFAPNGTKLWEYSKPKTQVTGVAPANTSSSVYITTEGRVHNISATGTTVWNISLYSDPFNNMEDIAAGTNGYIYTVSENYMHRLYPNGTTDWNRSDGTSYVIESDGRFGPGSRQPNASFTYTPDSPTTGNTTTFNASNSSDPDGTVTAYEWDFDNDGTVDATGKVVNHTYSIAGDYNATLTVKDDVTVRDTATRRVHVSGNHRPNATFTYTPASPLIGETITFNASNATDDGSITKYEWDFDGDGTYDATGDVVTHSYAEAGERRVTLRVTDDAGVTNTSTQTVRPFYDCSNTTKTDLIVDDFTDTELCEYTGDYQQFSLISSPTANGSTALAVNASSTGTYIVTANNSGHSLNYTITRGDRVTYYFQPNTTSGTYDIWFGSGWEVYIDRGGNSDALALTPPGGATSTTTLSSNLPMNTYSKVTLNFTRRGPVVAKVSVNGSQYARVSENKTAGRTGNITIRGHNSNVPPHAFFDFIHIEYRVLDDVEDGNLTEYAVSGDTSVGTTAYNGSNSIFFGKNGGNVYADESASYTLDYYPDQNETIEFYCQTEKGGGGKLARNCKFHFAVNKSDTSKKYTAQITTSNSTITLFKSDASGRTKLSETTTLKSLSTGTWYRGEVIYDQNTIYFYLYEMSGTILGDLGVSDSTYTDGLIGFGGTKSYVDYARITNMSGS